MALTTGALGWMASGDAATAARLAASMAGLQVSIGALNDLVDAPRDAATKPGKPIPRGAATVGDARLIVAMGLGAAVLLLVPSGLGALLVLAACAACGYGYDLRLSRTRLSWLPLAIALPLVPVFAWVGATGRLPAMLVGLLPAGVLAGAGLALANGLADVERDRSTGRASATVRLGRGRTWLLQAALLIAAVAVLVVARAGPARVDGGPQILVGGPDTLALAGGAVLLLAGIVLGAGGGADRRERAWELEAVAIALVAAGWLAGVAGLG